MKMTNVETHRDLTLLLDLDDTLLDNPRRSILAGHTPRKLARHLDPTSILRR